MGQSLLVTAEETVVPPILIVDKEGSIGLGLCSKLQNQAQVVLVSNREPEVKEHALFLPFSDVMPEIPEDQYSHIFFVLDDEKKEGSILYACMKKAQRDGSFFTLVLDKRKLTKSPELYLPAALRYGAVVIVGDIFNIPVHKKHAFVIERLFKEARETGALKLPNMGLVKLFPVVYLDVITAILQIAFSSKAKHTISRIYPSFAVTELGVARAMQKADPSLKVDFFTDTGESEKEVYDVGDFVLPSEYPVFELLERAFAGYHSEKKTTVAEVETSLAKEEETFATPLVPEKREKKKQHKGPLLYLVGFILTLLVLPVIVTVTFLWVGKLFLLSAKNEALSGKLSDAEVSIQSAQKALSLSEAGNQVLSLEAIVPQLDSCVLSLRNEQTSASSLAEGGENLLSAAHMVQQVLQGKSTSPDSDIREAVQAARSGYTQLQAVETSSLLPKDTNKHLSEVLQAITSLVNTSDLLPSALGLEKQKTYLVLFQNNMELRPGGGFIGSYGLLSFNKGKISDFSIHDVYDADGQLKGHVEPPFPIRRYMGVVHLYLRDSTFDVDFSKDAFTAAQMFHLETGQTVDGVIGVDLSFIKNILAKIGPVEVSDYQQTVTADNFSLLAENHAEKGFFPGSTQKKDFLSSVFTAIENKLFSNNVSYESLAQAVLTSVSQKHLLFVSANAAEQDVLTANMLSSTLWDPRPQDQINDYLGINEANLGVNKVNYFITRAVDQQATLTPLGDITGTDTLTINNTSKPTDPFAGTYAVYVRFILPLNAQMTGVSIDGQTQSVVPAVTDFLTYEKKTFTPPIGLEVDKQVEEGKAVYGMFVSVAQQGTRKIALSYTLKQAIAVGAATATYSTIFFKQPGTEGIPYTFTFSYPPDYRILSTSEGIDVHGQQAAFTKQLDTDTSLTIYLGKR